jgi:hypothetical protein
MGVDIDARANDMRLELWARRRKGANRVHP